MYNCCMVQLPGKKQQRPIIAAILVFVILGTFVLLSTEFFYGNETGENKPCPVALFAPVDHTVDWLAENAVSVNRTKKVSAPTFRSGGLRTLMLFKMYSSTEYHTVSSIYTTNPDYSQNIKNAIPLKLRI